MSRSSELGAPLHRRLRRSDDSIQRLPKSRRRPIDSIEVGLYERAGVLERPHRSRGFGRAPKQQKRIREHLHGNPREPAEQHRVHTTPGEESGVSGQRGGTGSHRVGELRPPVEHDIHERAAAGDLGLPGAPVGFERVHLGQAWRVDPARDEHRTDRVQRQPLVTIEFGELGATTGRHPASSTDARGRATPTAQQPPSGA